MSHSQPYDDSLKAGRELDALVATKVFGWTPLTEVPTGYDWLPSWRETGWHYTHDGDISPLNRCPFYSTDIAAAWEVVEKLHGTGMVKLWADEPDEWWCVVIDPVDTAHGDVASGNTAPMAICLVALKVVEGES